MVVLGTADRVGQEVSTWPPVGTAPTAAGCMAAGGAMRPAIRTSGSLIVLVLAAAAVAGVLAVTGPDDGIPAADGTHTPTLSPGVGSATPRPTEVDDPLAGPSDAEAAGAAAVLVAGRALAGDGEDASRLTRAPVYVVDADLDTATGEVTFDVAVAFNAYSTLTVAPLGFTPARHVVADAGSVPDVSAFRDGESVRVARGAAAGVLLVQLDPPLENGEPVLLRLRGRYTVPEAAAVAEAARARDEPPPFLAREEGSMFLEGWLPALAPWAHGDPPAELVGAGPAPPGVWTGRVTADRSIITSAVDGACDDHTGPCTAFEGVGIAHLGAILVDTGGTIERDAGELGLRVQTPPDGAAGAEQVAAIAAEAATAFADRFSALPWEEADLVPARIGTLELSGGSVMGLVALEPAAFTDEDLVFVRALVSHEVAHQWFGALVGGSAVVHESVAQYLAYVEIAEREGQEVADRFAEGLRRFHAEVTAAAGEEEEPPARASFDVSLEVMEALLYGRAALAWVEAERSLGRDTVTTFLSEIVERFRFQAIGPGDVVDAAEGTNEELHDILQRYWFDYEPIG